MEETTATQPMETTLAMNLPTFNSSNINIWFLHLQEIFNAKKMTSQRLRYCYIVENSRKSGELTWNYDWRPSILRQAIIK